MSDDIEQFEQDLRRRSLRPIPAGWRDQILREAQFAAGSAPAARLERRGAASLTHWISSLLWPHPAAWAALAAIWIFIFAVRFSIQDKPPVVAEKVSSPSPEMVAELRQQQRLFAELIGANDSRDADRQKVFLPRPRSERTEIMTA